MNISLVAYLQAPEIFIGYAFVLGLIVGSFLNVVIHRLPLMLERDWLAQCGELTNASGAATTPATEPYNLVLPRSRCPSCGHAIAAWENIPIISYLFLRGRCKGCGAHISVRYPTVEAIGGILTGLVAWKLGFGWAAAASMLLTWGLISLTFIDLDHQLLPDDITLPLLWLGLGLSVFGVFTDMQSAIFGAIAGYLSLWTVYHLFRLITGKEGMGYGDFKLFAVFGAWLGWQMLPLILLLSSLVGALVGISMVLLRGHKRDIPIPFGPYLAAAGWIALLWGHQITDWYLYRLSAF